MSLSPAMLNLVLTVGGAVGGAIATKLMGAIPRAWRGFKKDIEKEALHRQNEIIEAEKRARLELRIEQLTKDLQGVAEMVRKRFEDAQKALDRRFEKLKLKDNALESLLTGEVPRITDETEAVQ